MRIKRLDITGFKSFMERMVFSFDEGITAVVGPNGCGKSNVVDAIRWAMGEQSAKNLRGRGMEDVIFNGSETHPPLSMAEVTITFKVEPHDTLPETLAGLPEVSVTRRLFRSGESEYQINRTTTRLLDVTELFLGTGIGTKAYSIIEQGRVGQIVSARPEDRRAFIEEAAGITKYKARRKVAERKIEYTQANLLRVTDIVVELEKRLDSLERQAKKAEKYKRLKSEMKTIELHDYSHRWLELGAKKKTLEAQLESLSGAERERVQAVSGLETEIATRREALEKASAELEEKSQATYALEGQVKLDAQNLGHWQEDLDATRARAQTAEAELKDVSERRAAIEAEQQLKEEELGKLGVASREDEVTLEVRDEELRRSAELAKSVAERLSADRQELAELEKRTSSQAARLSGLEARKSELTQRIARVEGELEGLRAEESTLEHARTEVLERVESSRLVARELSQRRGEEEATLARLREAFVENEVLVLAAREALSDKRSRLSSLEEIQKNYEGYDRGVRAVMLKAGAEPKQAGVWGLVADVITAPPEYERAVEGALGERLQHVVVETRERGFELVEYLKGLAEGRSTFVPVPLEKAPLPEPLHEPGVLSMALSKVEVKDPALHPLVERLLGGVAIVPDLAVAKELSARLPAYTFVTLDGEVVDTLGTVTGGALEGPAVGALQKKREIAELSLEVAQIEERYNDLITRHYDLQKQTGHAEGVLKGLDKNSHAEELSLATHEKDLHTAGSGLVKLRERIAGLQAESGELTRTIASVDLELEAARGEAAHGETDRQAREDRVRLLQGELDSLEARAQVIRVETTELKVKVASTSERGQAARAAVDALSAQSRELTERQERLTLAVDEGQARIAELTGRLGETSETREARRLELEAKKAALETDKAAHAEALTQVRGEEERLKSLRATLDEMTSGLSNLSVEERTLAMEQEHIVTQLLERHGLSIGEAVHQAHMLPPLGPDAQERLKELRAQVERMGEVNVTAIEEHQEIATRFEFLSRQKKDLEESLKQLDQAIAKIDETSRVRFKETFDVVNEKFQAVFPRLFGGGRASLHLVQGGPGEEPGVEILAQPPGKKLQSVSLFSGGEKALTAVALIFGIFLIKPTPFCLLDEVDAPLDEGNVGRYNEMVREMSRASQFIVITHNKRTMEVADTLYGVTMQEPGVSKLVTVKLKEATAANDSQVA